MQFKWENSRTDYCLSQNKSDFAGCLLIDLLRFYSFQHISGGLKLFIYNIYSIF